MYLELLYRNLLIIERLLYDQWFLRFYVPFLWLETTTCPKEKGVCVQSNGADQNAGQIKVNSIDGNTQSAQAECLKHCHARKDATGCEVIWSNGNRGCYIHTQPIARGNNVAQHSCWVFSKCTGKTIKNLRMNSLLNIAIFLKF